MSGRLPNKLKAAEPRSHYFGNHRLRGGEGEAGPRYDYIAYSLIIKDPLLPNPILTLNLRTHGVVIYIERLFGQ